MSELTPKLEKVSSKKLNSVDIELLSRLINVEPKANEVEVEARKAATLIVTIKEKEKAALDGVIKDNTSQVINKVGLESGDKKEVDSTGQMNSIIYAYVLNNIDFEALSSYLKITASPALRDAIEEILRREHQRIHKEYLEVETVAECNELKHAESHGLSNTESGDNSETSDQEGNQLLFETLLATLPIVAGAAILASSLPDSRTSDETGMEMKSEIGEKLESEAPKEKVQQSDIKETLSDTFKKLNSNDKKHFCDVLKRACESFEHQPSKDIMQFHEDLKVMCQAFDKVEQMHKNNTQIKPKQGNALIF
jgi:hypothetical protein